MTPVPDGRRSSDTVRQAEPPRPPAITLTTAQSLLAIVVMIATLVGGAITIATSNTRLAVTVENLASAVREYRDETKASQLKTGDELGEVRREVRGLDTRVTRLESGR